jgi:hypothetical protein
VITLTQTIASTEVVVATGVQTKHTIDASRKHGQLPVGAVVAVSDNHIT